MDDIQPFNESGGGSPIHLGSQVICVPLSGVQNEFKMDQFEIKEESNEESEEMSFPIEIKNEIDSECATTSQNLEFIKRIKPKGSQYPCIECNYVATRADRLKRHREIKHEGIRYPCPECDYAATTSGALKKHRETKHEGIRYP